MRGEGGNPLRNRKTIKAIGLATGLGCSVVSGILLGVFGGLLIDRQIGTTPIFTLIGVLIGILAAGVTLYRLARAGR